MLKMYINSISSDDQENLFERMDQDLKKNLTDYQKLIILIIAVSLILITLLITICVVSPCCLVSGLVKKLIPNKFKFNIENQLNSKQKHYITTETKTFQLTVIPEYLEKQNLINKKTCLNLNKLNPINIYDNHVNNSLKEDLIKNKLFSNLNEDLDYNSNSIHFQDKNLNLKSIKKNVKYNLNYLDFNLEQYKNQVDNLSLIMCLRIEHPEQATLNATSNTNTRLIVYIKQIQNLPLNLNELDPSFYIKIIGLSSNYTFHKTSIQKLNTKLSSYLNFQSRTFKPSTSNEDLNITYISNSLNRSLLKSCILKLNFFVEEKYANDYSLAELTIQLKDILNEQKKSKAITFQDEKLAFKNFKLTKTLEFKGELLLSICFLPTSKRATFKIFKANLNNQCNLNDLNSNYFVRIIMFCDAKKIKKRKTCLSSNLIWQKNETISFDLIHLNENQCKKLCFLIILVNSQPILNEQTISSPSSSESINEKNASFKKDLFNLNESNKFLPKHDKFVPIGNFVLTSSVWNKINKQPRKQFKNWIKLV